MDYLEGGLPMARSAPAPDGRRVAAPAAWTDLPGHTFPPTPQRPLLHAPALRR